MAFTPNIDRNVAEYYIRSKSEGDYILRGKRNNKGRITVKTADGVKNIAVFMKDDKYTITGNTNFETMEELLAFYEKNKFAADGQKLRLNRRIHPFTKSNPNFREFEEKCTKELESHSWYYGELSKEIAESVLKSAKFEAGCFVVRRDNVDNEFTFKLSVLNGAGEVIHLSINQFFELKEGEVTNVSYGIGGRAVTASRFENIIDLLIHYDTNVLPKVNLTLGFAPMKEYFQNPDKSISGEPVTPDRSRIRSDVTTASLAANERDDIKSMVERLERLKTEASTQPSKSDSGYGSSSSSASSKSPSSSITSEKRRNIELLERLVPNKNLEGEARRVYPTYITTNEIEAIKPSAGGSGSESTVYMVNNATVSGPAHGTIIEEAEETEDISSEHSFEMVTVVSANTVVDTSQSELQTPS